MGKGNKERQIAVSDEAKAPWQIQPMFWDPLSGGNEGYDEGLFLSTSFNIIYIMRSRRFLVMSSFRFLEMSPLLSIKDYPLSLIRGRQRDNTNHEPQRTSD